MAKALDENKLNRPDLKILDINNPPIKDIPYEPFPKMVYLHPKDNTQEHRFKVVQTPSELETAQAKGWKTKPHIPVEPVEDLSAEFEAAPESSEDADPLESMSKTELLEEAAAHGITVDGRSSKETILAAIKADA